MTDPHGRPDGLLDRFTAARASATAADGLVRLTVDGTGDILDLGLDPRALRLPAADLAAAVLEAFAAARADVQTALQEQLSAAPVALPDGFGPLLRDVGSTAQRRLDDLTAAAQQIADRLGRPN